MALGKSIPMLDARERVTGTIEYATNLRVSGMLHARVLRSPLPHARITRIDASAAEAMPGVVAVLTAADFGTTALPNRHYGLSKLDQPVVAGDVVRFVGDPVALIAAESEDAAEDALYAIDVEYEELPAVYDAVEAIQPGAPTLHTDYPKNVLIHRKLRHGDLEIGFAEADAVIEETYTSPVAQQVSLEPHVSIAQWDGDQLTLWSGTQAPYAVRRVLAALYAVDESAIRIIVPPLGGGYGGKGHVRIEPMVTALARKIAGRPVRLALSRAEEFVTVTKHAATITIKTGFKHDGTLTARQVKIYWNGGAYADVTPILVTGGMVRAVGPYRIPHVSVDSIGIYTNLPPAAAYRGAMSSQTTWAYESHMDSIAHHLGMDPLALRQQNILRDGDTFATGEPMHDVHFAECLQSSADSLGYGEPLEQPAAPHLRRGRGVGVMMKSTVPSSRSECRLELSSQGVLTLYTSTVEMGQGAHTALAQVAAEASALPVERVRVVGPDTATTPFDSTTSASRSTNMMGTAIRNGGTELVKKLLDAASPILETPPEKLGVAAGYVYVIDAPDERVSYEEVLQRQGMALLDASGEYSTQLGIDLETGQGISTPHWHQGAGACEVEVDTETGHVRVLRYHAASFAGKVVNPALADLQNDGNVIFGLGPAMFEEIVTDHGQIVNPNLSDYMIPSFVDIPAEMASILLESDEGELHGIGEMTLPPVAPAIANAIYNATGVRIYDLPLTAERVLRALLERDTDE